MMTRYQPQVAFPFLMCASLTLALGSAGLRAQEGKQSPQPSAQPATQAAPKSTQQNGVPNQMALALRVEKAHGSTSKKISEFTSTLELELTDRSQPKGALVGLDVAFLTYQKPKRKRLTTLLRYEIRKAEQPIVRGQDRLGPWHLDNGKPSDLTAANKERDLQAFLEHKNLAKQLVRFLKPADVIRSLKNCSEVSEWDLRVTRAKTTKTIKIHGDIESFPMMRNAGEEAAARLTLYIDQKTDRVIAVDVTPVVDGEPAPKQGERIKLEKFQERNGLTVPHRLSYLWRDPNGALRSHSRVNILRLDLAPGLQQDSFDRKRSR